MPIVKWNEQLYGVNNEQIDSQHKKLFDLLNQLFDSMSKGESKEKLREVLNELVDYSAFHFSSEEAYFCKLKQYSQKGVHIDQHQQFIDTIRAFQSDFIQGKKLLTMDVFIYLRDWINSHIKKCDKVMCGHSCSA